MSTTKPIINACCNVVVPLKNSHKFKTRISIISSVNQATHVVKNVHLPTLQARKNDTRRLFTCNAVEQGTPPPSNPSPFNIIRWILRVVSLILPLLTNKWNSLLKIKHEVETAVEVAEEVVEAVGKVAEEVEKAAESIAHDLPEGGRLQRAVDFVEHVAERASDDAHLVHGFIDKVQEVEENVEKSIEFREGETSTTLPPQEEEMNQHLTHDDQ